MPPDLSLGLSVCSEISCHLLLLGGFIEWQDFFLYILFPFVNLELFPLFLWGITFFFLLLSFF
jgi:hypothetical protein